MNARLTYSKLLLAVVSLTATAGVQAKAQTNAQLSTQQLRTRIEDVRSGTVRMAFPAREGVCGDGQNWIRTRDGNQYGSWSGSRDIEATCDAGPVRVVIERDGGSTANIKTYVGGRWRTNADATDLGMVSAQAATDWLLSVAEQERGKAASNAIMAATLGEGVQPWPRMLAIAKNDNRPVDVRQQAIFWLSDVAGDKVSASLEKLAYDPGDREVREQAIFAMSRRPSEEAVPALLRMAETIKDRDLRKNAIFWLGRSKDPRAIAWIEQVLTKKD